MLVRNAFDGSIHSYYLCPDAIIVPWTLLLAGDEIVPTLAFADQAPGAFSTSASGGAAAHL
jgi:hypothetical protein